MRAGALPHLAGRSLADPLLHAGYLAAAAGALRVRASRRPTSSDASRRVRRDCLALLPAAAGVSCRPFERIAAAAPRKGLPHLAVHTLRAAASTRASDAQVRAAALVALVTDTAARPGAFALLTVADVDLVAGTVRLRETPPGGEQQAGGVLCVWLARRALLSAERVDALLVPVAGNHDRGWAVPAGLPLRPRGRSPR